MVFNIVNHIKGMDLGTIVVVAINKALAVKVSPKMHLYPSFI